MRSNIPTGKTYLWFAFLWNAVFLVIWMLSFVFFAAGYMLVGILTILLTGYGSICTAAR